MLLGLIPRFNCIILLTSITSAVMDRELFKEALLMSVTLLLRQKNYQKVVILAANVESPPHMGLMGCVDRDIVYNIVVKHFSIISGILEKYTPPRERVRKRYGRGTEEWHVGRTT